MKKVYVAGQRRHAKSSVPTTAWQPTDADELRRRLAGANAEAERCRVDRDAAEATVKRVRRMADEIERGEWGDHWREINVHQAIRDRLKCGHAPYWLDATEYGDLPASRRVCAGCGAETVST